MTMYGFDLIAGAVCFIIWLYLLLAHGRFWMVWRFEAATRAAGPYGPHRRSRPRA